jgi:melibiose permease/lactose/raffinose/galactose permease
MTTLSMDQKEREKISSAQRTSSYFGTYLTMVCILPVTAFFANITKSAQRAWLFFAVLSSFAMLLCQCLTVLGVKESGVIKKRCDQTSLKELFFIIIKNDQLVFIVITILCFNIGNTATAGLGIYYFKYIGKNENLYPVFSMIVGISQMTAMFVLPVIR